MIIPMPVAILRFDGIKAYLERKREKKVGQVKQWGGSLFPILMDAKLVDQ